MRGKRGWGSADTQGRGRERRRPDLLTRRMMEGETDGRPGQLQSRLFRSGGAGERGEFGFSKRLRADNAAGSATSVESGGGAE